MTQQLLHYLSCYIATHNSIKLIDKRISDEIPSMKDIIKIKLREVISI